MYPKKYLGQHFLTNEYVAERIAASLTGNGYEHVIEVGPGRGMLTKYLLGRNFRLLAVETDPELVRILQKHYPSLKVVQANFLKFELYEFTHSYPFALIGNFPYNISSQIVFKFLEYRSYACELIGMFQKEMAERIIAPPGSRAYGIISVLVQAYYEGEHLFNVDRSNFKPPPKVRSSVIRLVRKPQLELGCNTELFQRVVKTGFNQRRKMLRNSLKSLVTDPEILKDKFFDLRPEKLSVPDFVQLTKRIENHNR
jgi:16S rRNA (adenine1518-N6/adenine1519-N6)-dimethyltransferase